MIAPAPDHYWQVPNLDRRDRMIAGVGAGIAQELGVEAVWVRLAFVALLSAGGWGALLYVALWGWMSWHAYREAGTSATAAGTARTPKGRSKGERLLGFGAITLGLFILFRQLLGLPGQVVWPLGLLGVGLTLLWQRFGDRQPGQSLREPVEAARIVIGVVLVVLALALLGGRVADSPRTSAGLIVGLALGIGLLALSAPWWWRLLADLDAERAARIRSEERAEIAAHIHDSVLQTLSLIQRHGDDPQTMLSLARRQERELRNWLDPDRASRTGESLRGQLDQIVGDVEELHGLIIDVVVVGDCLIDNAVDALLGAIREAAVNAAKHAEVQRLDVYVEIGNDRIEAFVRDSGVGFDRAEMAGDRRGIRESIEQRMARVGGTAQIHTAPGSGTEVELSLPLGDGRRTRPEQETT